MVGGVDADVEGANTRYYSNGQERLEKLKGWASDFFHDAKKAQPICEHYGVFANTSDKLPVAGKFNDSSRISYLVGCNGVGQSMLSYGAYLLPGIMGYSALSEEENDLAELVSPLRDTLRGKQPKHL